MPIKRKWLPVWVILGVFSIAACGETYEDQERQLADLISEGRMGATADYWLELRGQRVALIFGFGSGDREVCKEIADDQNVRAQNTTAEYRCVPAN